jgi:anti-sigma factor ChrR (cupin superfamily)
MSDTYASSVPAKLSALPVGEGFQRLSLLDLARDRNQWPELRPGVRQCVLRDGPLPGERTSLLAYAPGAFVTWHHHAGDETIFVLEGIQEDETGRYTAGTWLLNPQGTRHSVKSPEGCLVLIHWRAPVEFIDTPA